jgi:hypothetical protein
MQVSWKQLLGIKQISLLIDLNLNLHSRAKDEKRTKKLTCSLHKKDVRKYIIELIIKFYCFAMSTWQFKITQNG